MRTRLSLPLLPNRRRVRGIAHALSVAALALACAAPATAARSSPDLDGLDAALLDDYAAVIGVAHNAGNSLDATRQAIALGADVIEIDVALLDGALVAAHFPPHLWPGSRAFRGSHLEEIWPHAAEAEAVLLDLKESSPTFLYLVLTFLAEHHTQQPVMVASRDAAVLRVLARRAPEAHLLLSVSTNRHWQQLQRDPELAVLIYGVTMRQDLIDAPTISWLKARGLFALAWPVNDVGRLNELVRLGVDGITTDDPAILELLGGQTRGERRLDRTQSTAEARPQPTQHEAEDARSQQQPGALDVEPPGNETDLVVLVVLDHEDDNERQYDRRHHHSGRAPPLPRLRRLTRLPRYNALLRHRPLPTPPYARSRQIFPRRALTGREPAFAAMIPSTSRLITSRDWRGVRP
ncbi:MAG: glycerophosphodiester phosphodiesterase family protein [Thermomicrobiales bacterium]